MNSTVGGSNFTSFSNSAIVDSNGFVAFYGSAGGSGVFRGDGQTLEKFAGSSTAIPNGSGTFSGIGHQPALQGNDVVFRGSGSDSQSGIYRSDGTTVTRVLDTSFTVPGHTENFRTFSDPLTSGSNIAFTGTFWENGTTTRYGIYLDATSGLQTVVESTMAIPDGTGNFTNFPEIFSLDGNNVSFQGSGLNSQLGIYKSVDGNLSTVADRTTAEPGEAGTFAGFGFSETSIDGTNVAFVAANSTRRGIYVEYDGILEKILDTDDVLDGKFISDLGIAATGFDNDQLAFWARYSDDSEGIYLAQMSSTPEPSSLALLSLAAAGAMILRRRQSG